MNSEDIKNIIVVMKFILSECDNTNLKGMYYSVGNVFFTFLKNNFDEQTHTEIMDYFKKHNLIFLINDFFFIDLFAIKKHVRKLKLELIEI